jgi:hypothetical protein
MASGPSRLAVLGAFPCAGYDPDPFAAHLYADAMLANEFGSFSDLNISEHDSLTQEGTVGASGGR